MAASGKKSIDDLLDAKVRKLAEQQRASEEMNKILTRENGLMDVSTKMMRNLEVAVVVSKRPGYFDYYKAPEEAQNVVRNDDLRHLTKKVARLQSELDQIDAEIKQIEQARQSNAATTTATGTEMSSLQQWFAKNGHPKQPPTGYYSSFQDDPKIYGGTSHHRAFRTQAMTMKKGRLTR